MNRNFDQFVQDNRHATDVVLFILSMVSGYFTYQGALLVLDQSSITNGFSVSACIFALGVTAALFLFWRYALGIVPKMKTKKTRWLGAGIVAIGGVFIVALSSWMNVMALAGTGALEAHMRSSLKEHNQSLQQAYSQARKVDRLIPDLEIAARRYAGLAQSEIRHGTLTGVKGAGGVADSLKSAQSSIQGLIQSLKIDSHRVNVLFDEGNATLKMMSDLVINDETVMKRIASFSNYAGELNRVIADLNNRALTSVVARTMRGLSASTGLHSLSLKNARVASAQKGALTRIADDLKQTGETIGLAADQLGKDTNDDFVAFERIGLATAVFVYSGSLIPYWAGGIGLDLMPVVLILMLMLLSAATGVNATVDAEVDDMRFGQVRKVILAMEGLQSDAGVESKQQQLTHQPVLVAEKTENVPALTEDDEVEWQQHLKG
jgi:hypothetical protein